MGKHGFFVLSVAVLLCLACTGDLAAQQAKPVALISGGVANLPGVFAGDAFGVWSGGALLVAEGRFSGAPVFRAFGPQGEELSTLTLAIPGVTSSKVYAFARGWDGSLAVGGSAYTDDGGTTFVAWVSADGQGHTFIRLTPFFPETLTVASDGTIWVAGHDSVPTGPDRDYGQHLIRRYDRSGKLLGSFVPWSSVGIAAPMTLSPDTYSVLVSSPDRIGWYSRVARTYIEFSLDGAILNSIQTPEHPLKVEMLSVGLCDDGSLYVAATRLAGRDQTTSWGIYALNREQREWSFIPRPEKYGYLYGCDGNRLASTTDPNAISWLAPAGE